jgi:O-antigen/teichoic acid export membrane protein
MVLRFRSYIFELTLWIFLPTIAGLAVFAIFPAYGFDSYPVIPASIIVLGILFYFILKEVPHLSDNKRMLLFYINILIKMILSLAIILFVILHDRTNALFFIITYFMFYIFLMIFEIRCFNRIIKLESKKRNQK